jgi:hypothetical protein
MSDQPNRILADANPAGIGYAFELEGVIQARGSVQTFEELHGLAARAGIYEIVITARRRRLEAEAFAKRFGWTFIPDQSAALAHESAVYALPPAA